MTWTKMLCAVAAASLGVATLAGAEEKKAAGATKTDDGYPLKTCVVSDHDLGEMGEPTVYVHEGRTVKFCCGHCVDTFKEEPAKYLKKIDEAAAKGGATTQPAKQEG